MKIFRNIAIACLACFVSVNASAGYSGLAKILTIQPHVGDRVFIKTETHNEAPSCAQDLQEWAIDLTTESGKAFYAAVLAAASQNKSVEVHGSHNCTNWPDREDVLFIVVPF
ncbi:hypothetical protein MAH1_28430 [Sessilibacter sp. MAH1]